MRVIVSGIASLLAAGLAQADYSDFNADGISESAFWNESDQLLYVLCGATENPLLVISPVLAQGCSLESVTPDPDLDGDAQPDLNLIVQAEVNGETSIWVQSHSSADGRLLGLLFPRPDGLLVHSDFNTAGDVDANDTIDSIDISLIVNAMQTGQYNASMDGHPDGTLDSNDVLEALSRAGDSTKNINGKALVNAVNAFDTSGFAPPTDIQEDLGLFGCIVCLFRCGRQYGDAWDCVRDFPDPYDSCFEDIGDLTDLDYSLCVQERTQQRLDECFGEIVDATSYCGRCIIKCAPSPRLVGDHPLGPGTHWRWYL